MDKLGRVRRFKTSGFHVSYTTARFASFRVDRVERWRRPRTISLPQDGPACSHHITYMMARSPPNFLPGSLSPTGNELNIYNFTQLDNADFKVGIGFEPSLRPLALSGT